jgi:hypothetical protein
MDSESLCASVRLRLSTAVFHKAVSTFIILAIGGLVVVVLAIGPNVRGFESG